MGFITAVHPYKFFEIDSSQLDSEKTVLFFKTAAGDENTEFKWLKDVDLEAIQDIHQATYEYYHSLVGTGELPFNYQFIPHILYKGSIDVTQAPVVKLIAL